MGGSLNASGTIYLYRALPAALPATGADRIAILFEEGAILAKPPENQLTLERITFSVARDYYVAGFDTDANGPDTVSLQYSTNGADFVDIGTAKAVPASDLEQSPVEIDLSAIGPQTDTVTLRLFGYGTTGTGEHLCLSNADSASSDYAAVGANLVVRGTTFETTKPGSELAMYDIAGNTTTVGVSSLAASSTTTVIASSITLGPGIEAGTGRKTSISGLKSVNGGSLCAKGFSNGSTPSRDEYFQIEITPPTVGPTGNTFVTLAHNFGWFEGSLDATRTNVGVILLDARHSVVRNSMVIHAENDAFRVTRADSNRLENISGFDSGYGGLYMNSSQENTIRNFHSVRAGTFGLALRSNANDNLIHDFRIDRTHGDGGFVMGLSVAGVQNNVFSNFLTSNSRHSGIDIQPNSHNNVFAQFYTVNNGNGGLNGGYSTDPVNGVLVMAGTSANHYTTGYKYYWMDKLSMLDCLATNNNRDNVRFEVSSDVRVNDLVSTHSGEYGVHNRFSEDVVYSGILKLGQNADGACWDDGSVSNPGFVSGTCVPQGSSTASVSLGLSSEASFLGKLTHDDALNTSDTDGTASFSEDIEWAKFETEPRSWGPDGMPFPDTSHRGWCNDGTCRIWDWALTSGDSVALNVHDVLPTGNETRTHTWSDDTTTVFLDNAMELIADGVGNDNALCESNETCVFLPNVGTYQGHGQLVSTGPFVDGTLINIRLLRYEHNGR